MPPKTPEVYRGCHATNDPVRVLSLLCTQMQLLPDTTCQCQTHNARLSQQPLACPAEAELQEGRLPCQQS